MSTSIKMKILYISSPSFLDMDLSLVKSLNELDECFFLLDLYPKLWRSTVLDVSSAPADHGIYPMSSFNGFEIFAKFMALDNCYVINRTSNSPLHLSNLDLQIQLMNFVIKLSPDVIHFNNILYFNHFYLLWFRHKLLVSIHDPFPHSGEEAEALRFSHRFYRKINTLFIKNHLLYNNIMVADYAVDRKISQSRVHAASLGPYECLNVFESDKLQDEVDFLFFGRIQRYKGLDLLLEAFTNVISKHPNATLTIAGSGSFWFDIASYPIPPKNIRIINRFIPACELSELIISSRVVVCPYRDATQSGVVMSAYGLHKPVIVTGVGALPRSVENGITGVVVPPNDPEALASAMIDFLAIQRNDRKYRDAIEQIYHNGEKSWKAISVNLTRIYRSVICKPKNVL